MRWKNAKLALIGLTVLAAPAVLGVAGAPALEAKKSNIVFIWGDDIGQSNLRAYTNGLMGYRTPNINSIAQQGESEETESRHE